MVKLDDARVVQVDVVGRRSLTSRVVNEANSWHKAGSIKQTSEYVLVRSTFLVIVTAEY